MGGKFRPVKVIISIVFWRDNARRGWPGPGIALVISGAVDLTAGSLQNLPSDGKEAAKAEGRPPYPGRASLVESSVANSRRVHRGNRAGIWREPASKLQNCSSLASDYGAQETSESQTRGAGVCLLPADQPQ